MATDGPTPSPCDMEVFNNGNPIALIDGPSNAIENWVKMIAELSGAQIDWHYSGGVAQVLYLGDESTHEKLAEIMKENVSKSRNLTSIVLLSFGHEGRHRRGVNDLPSNILATF